MGRRKFTILFVDDSEIARLNSAYRGKRRPTDVLSFSWKSSGHSDNGFPTQEFKNHLGDIVISAETARRNARIEDHSTNTEICWLILHGVLHLLGWDHEADRGEMTALEHSLRAKLSG